MPPVSFYTPQNMRFSGGIERDRDMKWVKDTLTQVIQQQINDRFNANNKHCNFRIHIAVQVLKFLSREPESFL